VLASASELEELLDRVVGAGRDAWPDLALSAEAFLRHVAERLPAQGDPIESVRALHAEDLYLACACAAGDPEAVRVFDERFLAPTAAHVSRARGLPGLTDDLKQLVRSRLLVAADGVAPRIGGYSGQGPLGAWVRMAATRLATNLRNAERSRRRRDAIAPVPLHSGTPAADPELAYLRSRFSGEFETAFRETLAALSPRERDILRLHFIDGMTTEAISNTYEVSMRTVQRWLERTRERILRRTRRLLADRLDLTATQIDGLVALFQSQFDLSVSVILRGRDA
jgi:RNA polymerase sigma-70 factor (ECF subfamily)